MDFFQQGKLLAHNAALYFPTTSALLSADVLTLRVANMQIATSAWDLWCSKNATSDTHHRAKAFNTPIRREQVLKTMRERGIRLRKTSNKEKKRTPFNLVSSLVR